MASKIYDYLIGNLAEEQLTEIIEYYEEVKGGMGLEFLLSFEQALDLLSTNPKIQDTVYKMLRRMNLKRFPYALFYRIDEQQQLIIVTTVVHEKKVTKTYTKNIPLD